MPARLCRLRNAKLIPVTRFLPALFYFLQKRPLRRNRKSPALAVVQQQIDPYPAPVHFDSMESIKLRQVRETNFKHYVGAHGWRVFRDDVRPAFTDVAAVALAFMRHAVSPDPMESNWSAQWIAYLASHLRRVFSFRDARHLCIADLQHALFHVRVSSRGANNSCCIKAPQEAQSHFARCLSSPRTLADALAETIVPPGVRAARNIVCRTERNIHPTYSEYGMRTGRGA